MRKIDAATKTLIQERIADVEKTCDSELVCLVTKRSARYVLYPLLTAAILSLMLPLMQAFAGLFGFHDFTLRFQHQTIVFVVLAIVFTCTPIRHMVTPKWLQQQNCARYSTEQFFRHHLHETRARNAILIFVSWEEKYVTIIADKGINERVQQSDWDDLITGFVTAIKADDMANGFLSIIGGAGDLLIKHFPVDSPKTDELPNHLIELDDVPYIS
jgi:putative membrane protein